jgi:3-dehydroquinate synthase
MQESFEISSSSDHYTVTIGEGIVAHVIETYPDAIYLVDDFFIGKLEIPSDQSIYIHADEETKSLDRISEVIIKLRQLGANRSTHMVAIGGGVIQDIATFVASLYMRGIGWSYMPSTLLSMTDSCIGGKSSINVAGIKNLVGNFYPPKEIYIDVRFASSLDSEQIVGGLFEAEKISYARGQSEYKSYLAELPSHDVGLDVLHRIISKSLIAKKWFIEVDEFDHKERLLLNFGHTFGHAIEAGTGFFVTHGIAVGIGMLVAARYSQLKGLVDSDANVRVNQLVEHVRKMIQSIHLNEPKIIDLNLFMKKFEGDKKHKKDVYRIVCPTGSGDLELISVNKNLETQSLILEAYKAALTDIGWKVAV